MAQLMVNLDDQFLGQYPLSTNRPVTLGRSPQCTIVLDNPAVSGLHAIFRYEKGVYVVEDRGSTNGIIINGKRIKNHTLKDGEVMEILRFRIKFWMQIKSEFDTMETEVMLNDAEKAVLEKEKADSPHEAEETQELEFKIDKKPKRSQPH